MITVTLPVWFVWLLTFALAFSCANDVLKAIQWYSERKLRKLRGER